MMLAVVCALPLASMGAPLDTIGVTLLRTVIPDLNGEGVRVAQVEGPVNGANQPPAFEVNPTDANVTQPTSLFTYYSSLVGSPATTYPNTIGANSYHANYVAGSFFGLPFGVATNVTHVDNYEELHFLNSIVFDPYPPTPAIPASIVNQSFIMIGSTDTNLQLQYDQGFDDYAAAHGTLFVSGVGNADPNYYFGAVNSPASCYNGMGVAAYGTVNSSVGPTLDNGRSKPDITSPALPTLATSYSTPMVAGSAAVLRQAGLRGDGGVDTSSATDMRTLKALLLNGAVKPTDWTNSTTSPLDTRYGAGVVNVFNSYVQLTGGKHAAIELTSVNKGDPHPPGSGSSNILSHRGWDFRALSSGNNSDSINHYYFDLTNQFGAAPFTATATLVWIRHEGKTDINDLNLYLYNATTGTLVAESISPVDNVEHLHIETLSPGRYDLQVLKRGGTPNTPPRVIDPESYALTWEFFNVPLAIEATNGTATLTWPIYPTGFRLQTKSSLAPLVNWSTPAQTPLVTNGFNRLEWPIGSTPAFFRLKQQP